MFGIEICVGECTCLSVNLRLGVRVFGDAQAIQLKPTFNIYFV